LLARRHGLDVGGCGDDLAGEALKRSGHLCSRRLEGALHRRRSNTTCL
jgi:hypothetical protein